MTSEGSFLHGFHPLRERLRRQPRGVVEVWCAARPGKRRAEIEGLCRRNGIAVLQVPVARLDERSSQGTHNGFGAVVRGRTSDRCQQGDPDFKLLVEDIQDPRNLGALLRVCESAGISQVLIRDRGSAPLSPLVGKTSAGASEWLRIDRITNTAREVARLKNAGFWVYGADAAGEPPWKLDLTGKVVLCMGGEANGLRALTREVCDGLVGLPMLGRVESLNLSTAAAAILYDAVRQRLGGSV